jgi:hypothetical protein
MDMLEFLTTVGTAILEDQEALDYITVSLNGRNPDDVPELELLFIIRCAAKIAKRNLKKNGS